MPTPPRLAERHKSGVLVRRAGTRWPDAAPLDDGPQPARQPAWSSADPEPRNTRLPAALAAWQEARRALPASPAPKPRARRLGLRSFVLRLALALVLGVLVLHLVPHQQVASTAMPSPRSGGSAHVTSGAGQTPLPASTTPAEQASPLAQVATSFLSAYFSWQATDTDNAYAGRWLPDVAPAARRDLLLASPRLTLDSGADSAAESPAPLLSAEVLQRGPAQVVWTIQVLPPGGEQVAWQPRQIVARLSLIQTTTGPQVISITWTSSPEGGTA